MRKLGGWAFVWAAVSTFASVQEFGQRCCVFLTALLCFAEGAHELTLNRASGVLVRFAFWRLPWIVLRQICLLPRLPPLEGGRSLLCLLPRGQPVWLASPTKGMQSQGSRQFSISLQPMVCTFSRRCQLAHGGSQVRVPSAHQRTSQHYK